MIEMGRIQDQSPLVGIVAMALIVLAVVADTILSRQAEIEAACKGGCHLVGPQIPVGFVMVAVSGLMLLAAWLVGPDWIGVDGE
jgi:hypothetical protein